MQRVAQIVQVLDEDGQPCREVVIAVTSAAGPVPEMAYVTGEDGCARIGLPPGSAELEVIADGASQRFSIEAATEPGRAHELRMSRASP